jgi:hypothetical protein
MSSADRTLRRGPLGPVAPSTATASHSRSSRLTGSTIKSISAGGPPSSGNTRTRHSSSSTNNRCGSAYPAAGSAAGRPALTEHPPSER